MENGEIYVKGKTEAQVVATGGGMVSLKCLTEIGNTFLQNREELLSGKSRWKLKSKQKPEENITEIKELKENLDKNNM